MSMAEFDDLVTRLKATGVGREAAEKFAATEYPTVAAERAAEDAKRDNVLEKTEQLEVMKLFRAFGFEVYNLSQARASKQTPGIPDLWCMHREQPIAFYWETKRASGGRFSEAQIRFRDAAQRCNVGYGSGSKRDAERHLISLGLAYVTAIGTLEPMRERQVQQVQRA